MIFDLFLYAVENSTPEFEMAPIILTLEPHSLRQIAAHRKGGILMLPDFALYLPRRVDVSFMQMISVFSLRYFIILQVKI